MDFFSKFKSKSKTFQEELGEVETKLKTSSIYELSKQLENLIKKKKIKNIQEIENYLFNIQYYPLIDKFDDSRYNVENDKLLTLLIFYSWLGGSKCIPQDNNDCMQNLSHFLKVHNKYKDNFEPFLGMELIDRNILLRNKARYVGHLNQILITLNHRISGGFIVLDIYGTPYYWDLSNNQNKGLVEFIENIKSKFNTKNKEEYYSPSLNPKYSKYIPPKKGEECIDEDMEKIIQLLVEDIESPQIKSEEEKKELNKKYKKLSIKIHPDKVNTTTLAEKNKERCIDLFKVLSDLISTL
jgi:hypothetical protein